ncbi:MAG: hypothetical protein JJU05_03245 [Verrucomicrobia bacterium]|nr:hypothetical protein [Verrucomicrobiota bacterium]MCH8528429.1 OprO/OprP family phosphate-selective porin [Kiritimatiellia bacterium]
MKQTWIKMLAGLSAVGMMSVTIAEQTVRPAGRFVQDIRVRGRVQTQFGYSDVSNDEGSSDYSTFEVRRARIGIRGNFENNFRAQAEANVVPGSNLSMRSAYVEWREHKAANVKVGFDKPFTSIEENTSSASILTVERTLLSNTVAAVGPTNGLAVHGDLGTFFYGAGVYTGENNTNTANESVNYMTNLMVGLNLDGMVSEGSRLRIRGAYLNHDDENSNSSFEDVYAIGFHFAQGGFDLRAEYMLGDNDGTETSGFYIMPSLMLSDKLQGVARYEMSESDSATGLRAASRYARRVDILEEGDTQRGDEHWALYLGVNYYLNGDGNKLMFGVEFAELDNTSAGTLESTSVYGAWRMLF